MKKQRGVDKPDKRGEMPDQVSPAISLNFGTTERETYYDPLQPLLGPIANVTPITSAKKKKPKPVGPLDDAQIKENRERRYRYDTFIRALLDNHGDRVKALAITYGVPNDEIENQFQNYLADVALGRNSSSVSDLLEEYGAGKASRVAKLSQHLFDADPKVSLVALKLAADLDGDKHDVGQGSLEKYLREVVGMGK